MADVMNVTDVRKRRDLVSMAAEARAVAGPRCGMRMRTLRIALAGVFALACSLIPLSSPASAAYNHPVEAIHPTGVGCDGRIAVAEATGLVYVVCQGSSHPVIERFDVNGNLAPFSASEPYISGNTITGNPNSPELKFGGGGARNLIAVDNSSAHPGYLYVAMGCEACGGTTEQEVDIFTPAGQYVGNFPTGYYEGGAEGLDVDASGFIYVTNGPGGPEPGSEKVRKYDPASFAEVRRLFSTHIRRGGAVDSTGAIWTGYEDETPNLYLVKWEADQFGTNLNTGKFKNEGVLEATFSPFLPGGKPILIASSFGETPKIDVDLSNDDLYIDSGSDITPMSTGSAEEEVHQNGPTFGAGPLSGSGGIAVTKDGHVYATTQLTGPPQGGFVKFGPGGILPNVRTPAAQIGDLGHTSATLRAHIDRFGGPNITECELEYGPGAGSYDKTSPCSPDPNASPPGSNFSAATTDVSSTPTGLTVGALYHYRFKAVNSNGANYGGDRTFRPAYVIKLQTEGASGINTHSATLHASFDPDGTATKYFFEYGADTDYGQVTPQLETATITGKADVEATIGSLPQGKTFHYRIVASANGGTSTGEDRTFRVASPPEVSGVRATDVREGSAVLNARIDSIGFNTSYRFDYGPTPEYGSSVPIPNEEAIGAATLPQAVSQAVEGLQAGVTYHFRVVAKNEWGTTESADTTFDFAPPNCPNSHVRQQTGSNYLPDCRAYELVSPGNAGQVTLFPSDELRLNVFVGEEDRALWPVNRGLASGPSRFSYWGGLGVVEGGFPPNSFFDMYMATRTGNGWVTTVPGLKGSEWTSIGEKQCSDSLDLCLDHKTRDLYGTVETQHAPYLFRVDGTPLGQLPTNVNVVPGGDKFVGDQRPSYDFSHFVFSSRTAVFAPGGLSTSPGSAYDNDLAAKTVTLISRLEGGAPIPADVGGTQVIEFPGISTDGSHILMQVPGVGGGYHLYMRANGLTYDVSRGKGVTYVGMTRSGTKVYFATDEQLESDDTDTSTDLYMWSQAGDTLTRVSEGNGQGNLEDCSPSWTTNCGIEPIVPDNENPFEKKSVPGLNDKIARVTGDVYFYSPSLLDAGSPGLVNQRNLYVYREGSVRLVATLEASKPITRMQISPDGSHAAMLTASRLTGYDNRGFKEMYTYDAETGNVRCASCRTDGVAPTGGVEASEGGPFMADDGRVFFVTTDPLVSQDTDRIRDVYEFVSGRPQLITAGTGTRDSTGSETSSNPFFPSVHTGLESVSADGVDVYFSTFDSLVPQDVNGPFVKFYDARTGGGFDILPDLGPCAAADECHGPGNPAPAPPAISTAGNLGNTGNAMPVKTRRKKHVKNGRRRKKRHVGAHVRNGHG